MCYRIFYLCVSLVIDYSVLPLPNFSIFVSIDIIFYFNIYSCGSHFILLPFQYVCVCVCVCVRACAYACVQVFACAKLWCRILVSEYYLQINSRGKTYLFILEFSPIKNDK